MAGKRRVERRRVGINAALYGKGEAVAARVDSGGAAYFGKDVLGSVRTVTGEYGQIEERYEYDAFGKPYQGEFDQGLNLGYTGKPYDTATGLYDYGYRDYAPEAARFTTVDPVRDGANWFVYVNNDPVNWVDRFGEMPQAVFGAIVGFVSSTVAEIGGRMTSGQSFTEAVSNTMNDPVALTNIATSTVMGGLTAGVSSWLTAGATQVGKVATTNVIVNTIGGAIDGTARTVIGNAVTEQPQNVTQTITAAVTGLGTAAVFSGVTQGVIARGSMTTTTTFSNNYGVTAGTRIKEPSWSKVAEVAGENGIPTVVGIIETGITGEKPAQGGKNH
ncbi:MAG: RHS repeat-associated core domain-containing protein [Treponema sp.]|nr:RHS repeat-associated core domain-containing protein [Treponema sp.]